MMSIITFFSSLLVLLYLVGMHFQPISDHPISYFLEYVPDYILVILAAPILFTKMRFKYWVFCFFLLMILISSPFQLNLLKGSEESLKYDTLNIASFNVAQRVDEAVLYAWFRHHDIDILFIQEARDKQLDAAEENDLYSSCKPRLCVLSKYPIEDYETIDRRALEEWGLFASLHSILVGKKKVFLMNTHFASISNFGFEFSSLNGFLSKMILFKESKAIEFGLVKSMLSSFVYDEHFIIAGDFNITDRNPQYKKYWGNFENLFREVGFGYGSTRIHPWLSPRIDHVLISNKLKANKALVGNDLGSDHLPILGNISLLDE
ncbi:endonuclease/exonuclease/phosphatase family protein [Alteromonas naphthalenivorans]|nr:endonuclease/exonuclease/phosphatase family protein [Alteromonas naphthalenivorans]